MSFILDALKRAERERKLEKAPDLSAIYQDERVNRRKYRPWFWGGGVALVLLAVVVVILWPKEPSAPPPTVSAPSKGPAVKGPSTPLPSAGKAVKRTAPAAPALPAEKKPRIIKEERSAPDRPLPVSQESVQKRVASVRRPHEPPAPPPPGERIAPPKPVTEPVDKTVVSRAGMRPPADTPKVVPKAPPMPLYEELPEEIQSVLGPLEINVHMYSPNPPERRVFINMKGYREGDVIGESGFRLVEITAYGVVIDTGKGKALLEVSGK